MNLYASGPGAVETPDWLPYQHLLIKDKTFSQVQCCDGWRDDPSLHDSFLNLPSGQLGGIPKTSKTFSGKNLTVTFATCYLPE